jgi:protein-L-isoaspartate(D-aspartate) O-methyltransferase
MHPREPAWSNQPDPPESTSPEAARARLVTELRHRGSGLSRSVQEAFARVPRHVFVPEVGAAAAYRDEAFVIKCGPDGLPVSSSSQPAMMAIMLDQLGLRPGHRVLEIGTGSGYNAAVMGAVVGPGGEVVSVDIDADLVTRARSSLAAAGYDTLTVRCADGGFGDPAGAPFDRIIVTAGAWDIAPAWLDQLGPGGRLVLPLSVRGIQLSVALERAGGEDWLSTSAWRCGFVRMLGAFAGPELVLRLGEPRPLLAQMSDGSPVDGPALQQAIAGPAEDVPVVARLVSLSDLADLDLWLAVTNADLARLTLLAAPGGWLRLAPLLPVGALVGDATDPERMGIAVLLPAELAGRAPVGPAAPANAGGSAGPGNAGGPEAITPAAVFAGFGPTGAAVAARLAERTVDWAALGRPGAQQMQLIVRPASAAAGPAAPGCLVLRRPSVTIEVGWPG